MFVEWPDLVAEDRSARIRQLFQTHGESIVRHFNKRGEEARRRDDAQILTDANFLLLDALEAEDDASYAPTMSEIIFKITENGPDGGFTARALGHAIFTEADTLEVLRVNMREAVLCHFDEGQSPAVIRLHGVVDELIAVA